MAKGSTPLAQCHKLKNNMKQVNCLEPKESQLAATHRQLATYVSLHSFTILFLRLLGIHKISQTQLQRVVLSPVTHLHLLMFISRFPTLTV